MTWPRRRRFSAVSYERDQVFGFFLHLDVAVAQHAESALASCTWKPGNSSRQEHADQGLDADEADRGASAVRVSAAGG